MNNSNSHFEKRQMLDEKSLCQEDRYQTEKAKQDLKFMNPHYNALEKLILNSSKSSQKIVNSNSQYNTFSESNLYDAQFVKLMSGNDRVETIDNSKNLKPQISDTGLHGFNHSLKELLTKVNQENLRKSQHEIENMDSLYSKGQKAGTSNKKLIKDDADDLVNFSVGSSISEFGNMGILKAKTKSSLRKASIETIGEHETPESEFDDQKDKSMKDSDNEQQSNQTINKLHSNINEFNSKGGSKFFKSTFNAKNNNNQLMPDSHSSLQVKDHQPNITFQDVTGKDLGSNINESFSALDQIKKAMEFNSQSYLSSNTHLQNLNSNNTSKQTNLLVDSKLKALMEYNLGIGERIKFIKERLKGHPTIKCKGQGLLSVTTKILENIIKFVSNSDILVLSASSRKVRDQMKELIKYKAKNISLQFTQKYKKHFVISSTKVIWEKYVRESNENESSKIESKLI